MQFGLLSRTSELHPVPLRQLSLSESRVKRKRHMTASGHSRLGRDDGRSSHFRHLPIATGSCDATKNLDVPKGDIPDQLDTSVNGSLAQERKHHVNDEHQSAGSGDIAANPRHQDPVAEQVGNVELFYRTCYEEKPRW